MWTKVHPELGKAIAEKQKFYNEQVGNLIFFSYLAKLMPQFLLSSPRRSSPTCKRASVGNRRRNEMKKKRRCPPPL